MTDKMQFIANENVARTIIEELRTRGHDVRSVKESMRGQSDEEILACALNENRIVLTHDKDFGELAVRIQLPQSCGVILLRTSGVTPQRDNERILEALESRADWVGHFSVISDTRIRMRPLSSRSRNSET